MRTRLRRYRLALSLLFALIGGGAAFLAVARPDESEAVATERVVVAAQGLAVGERLRADQFTTADMAKGAVPADALRSPADATGAYATLPLVKGEMLLRSKISGEPPGSRLAAVIPEGRVAVSVAVNDVISTGGFIAPGDSVDVLGVVTKNPGDAAQVVLRDIRVLAVSNAIIGSGKTNEGEKKKDGRDNPSTLDTTVTLAVTLDEAQRLVQIDQVGTLRLALRRRAGS